MKAKKIKKTEQTIEHKKTKKIKKTKDNKKWFVAYFSPGYWKKLEKIILTNKKFKNNVEIWYPMEEVVVIQKGKKVIKKEPLYPGYVFFKFNENSNIWLEIIRKTPVFGFIKEELKSGIKKPIPLTDLEVQKIKLRTKKSNIVDYSYLVGKRVIVVNGPFEGFTGICKNLIKSRNSAKVELELINSLIREVEIGVEMLEINTQNK